jgi:hypothetical protein
VPADRLAVGVGAGPDIAEHNGSTSAESVVSAAEGVVETGDAAVVAVDVVNTLPFYRLGKCCDAAIAPLLVVSSSRSWTCGIGG